MNSDILSGKKKSSKKTTVVNLGKKGGFKIHPGKLHRALGIAEDKPIPKERLQEALRSKDPEIRNMARSAVGLEHMDKK